MEQQNHWAASLGVGDNVKATIRHATDGSKNIHGSIVTVVFNNSFKSIIVGHYNGSNYTIPYNELSKINRKNAIQP